MGIVRWSKREAAERVLGRTLAFVGNDPARRSGYVLKAIERIASGEKQTIIREWAQGWFEEGNPGCDFLAAVLSNIHPNVRRRFVARMIVSMLFRDREVGERSMQKYGVNPPYVMLVSPSMRCNYRCEGCYAASYTRKDDMRPEVFDRVLAEAEQIGTNFFSILGGEPFLYPDLLPVIRKHGRSFFQIYSNGSFIDEAEACELVELGNVAPQLSVNGPDEYTDETRGKGAFAQVMRAMDCLRQAGAVFGFSTLVTSRNADMICSEEWIDLLIRKGATYGWLFLYMPVGADCDTSLMPTPEQRNKVRAAMRLYRRTKPIIPLDFWSDGTLTGGCIAGGRLYFHVNHRGDVEPCIFCHFATHNVNSCTVADALGSPFFRAIRERQPFGYNTLLPCPMIDHPGKMWSIIQETGARATHEGAERIFTDLAGDIKDYSERVGRLMDEVWYRERYAGWAGHWTGLCGVPPARLETRRHEFEEATRFLLGEGNGQTEGEPTARV